MKVLDNNLEAYCTGTHMKKSETDKKKIRYRNQKSSMQKLAKLS